LHQIDGWSQKLLDEAEELKYPCMADDKPDDVIRQAADPYRTEQWKTALLVSDHPNDAPETFQERLWLS
jgi:hypothetical protein